MAWVDRLHEAGQTLVAGAATGSHRLWRFAVSVSVVVRRQPAPDQPRLADRGRTVAARATAPAARFRPPPSISTRSSDSSTTLLETAWKNFAGGARSDLRSGFERLRSGTVPTGSTTTRCSARSRPDTTAPRICSGRKSSSAAGRPRSTQARRDLASQIDQVRFAQFLLFRQGARLKAHARAKGVRLIGDLPFFVSPDSSDVWAIPGAVPARRAAPAARRRRRAAGLFQRAKDSGGAIRSMTGTRWPRAATAGASTACAPCSLTSTRSASIISEASRRRGTYRPRRRRRDPVDWVPGPGADFFSAVEKAFGGRAVRRRGPGDHHAGRERAPRRISRSRGRAFCSSPSTAIPTIRYLPDNYVPNTVVYTGTHDNPTTRGWYEDLPDAERRNLWRYLKRAARHQRGRRVRLVGSGVVVGRRARDRPVAGRSQPG